MREGAFSFLIFPHCNLEKETGHLPTDESG